MTALLKIRQAGFALNLIGDSFEIKPASLLTQNQREFLKTHKAEIIANLKQQQIAKLQAWLEDIDETDAELIADFFEQCQNDPAALQYFLKRADEKQTPTPEKTGG